MEATWVHPQTRMPKAGKRVLLHLRSMMGNPIIVIASHDENAWLLQGGSFLERPDWIVGWYRIPTGVSAESYASLWRTVIADQSCNTYVGAG